MKTETFSVQAEAFVKSLIRLRIRLIQTDRSKNPTAGTDAEFIRRHLEAYPNRTNQQMANFWIRNSLAIFNLIPGLDSNSHQSLVDRFNTLNQIASNLHHHYNLTPGQGHKASVL